MVIRVINTDCALIYVPVCILFFPVLLFASFAGPVSHPEMNFITRKDKMYVQAAFYCFSQDLLVDCFKPTEVSVFPPSFLPPPYLLVALFGFLTLPAPMSPVPPVSL